MEVLPSFLSLFLSFFSFSSQRISLRENFSPLLFQSDPFTRIELRELFIPFYLLLEQYFLFFILSTLSLSLFTQTFVFLYHVPPVSTAKNEAAKKLLPISLFDFQSNNFNFSLPILSIIALSLSCSPFFLSLLSR